MTDAAADIDNFLRDTGRQGWLKTPIAGDASNRSYLRLTGPAGETAILMDARKSALAETARFACLAMHLHQKGFAAPRVLDKSPAGDVLVLSDLGPVDFATHLRDSPGDEEALYLAASDVLCKLAATPAPAGLEAMTPEVAGDMVRLAMTEYVARPECADRLAGLVTEAMGRNCSAPTVFALRDFHAENLIWRPAKSGTDRVGVLDFQDAVLAPLGYDLVSMLRDARIDVRDETTRHATHSFCRHLDLDSGAFAAQFATLSVQRNLRILGVFARLIKASGKQKYRKFMPRVWAHMQSDLSHPALAELQRFVQDVLAPPQTLGFHEVASA